MKKFQIPDSKFSKISGNNKIAIDRKAFNNFINFKVYLTYYFSHLKEVHIHHFSGN